MNRRRGRLLWQMAFLVLFAAGLWLAFPYAALFVEGAALNLRRFWWVVLLIALAIWLIWTAGKRNPD